MWTASSSDSLRISIGTSAYPLAPLAERKDAPDILDRHSTAAGGNSIVTILSVPSTAPARRGRRNRR
jgi:hypothetical protein